MEVVRKTYQLTADSCDEVSDLIVDFCESMHVDPTDTTRYRLSAEDCLWHWLTTGCENNTMTLRMGRRFRVPYVILEIEGSQDNPTTAEGEDFGSFCGSVLVSLNLKPEYSYAGGHNRVSFRMKRKSVNRMAFMGLMLAAALVTGFLGLLLPETVRETLLNSIVLPVYEAFFRALSCVAAPMIFCSVTWGIYGMGDVETLGRIGKKMILRFLKIVLIAACFASLCFPLFVQGLSASEGFGGELSAVTEMILGIVPSNIVEPFLNGNTLQIIFLAAVVGIALLVLGRRTGSVASAVDQANSLTGFLMAAISKLLPFVLYLVVVDMIWSGMLSTVTGVWKFVLLYAAAILVTSGAFLLLTAWHRKVSPALLIRKCTGSFVAVASSGSSAAAFNSLVETCEQQFGIDSSLAGFGVPLGMIMHAPILTVYYLFLVFFLAGQYHVPCSIGWILTGILLSSVMAVAAPATSSGEVVIYAMLLSQMGIPSEALAIAIALDAVTGFLFDEAFEQSIMTMTLLNVAAEMNMVDLDLLHAKPETRD